MIDFFAALNAAFKTLLIHPKLFLPKIFIAALYSVQILFLPGVTIDAFQSPGLDVLNALIFWIFYIFAVMVLDILVSAMYPFIVKDFFDKKEISMTNALKNSSKKFFKIAPAVILVMLVLIVAITLLSLPLGIFLLSNNFLGLLLIFGIILLIVFLLGAFFYMLFPVATLEQKGVFASLKKSFSISRSNFSVVSKATIFSLFLSLASFLLAFIIEFSSEQFFAGSVIAFLLFILIRFITSLIATYQYVLNPVFYIEIKKEGRLK